MSICGDMFQTDVGGEIMSPGWFGREGGRDNVICSTILFIGFPGTYLNNVECIWMIRVKESQNILLNIMSFDLGQSGW